MRRSAILAAAFAAFGLSACVSLKEPIGTSVGFRNDPTLEGLWVGGSEKDRKQGAITYGHVILNDDNTMTVVGVSPRVGEHKASWGTLQLTTVKLGDNRYLNEIETSADGKPPADGDKASMPAFYRLRGDTLTIYMFDTDKVAKDVDAGRIAGIVHRTDQDHMVQSVEVTADGLAMDAWLAGPDAPKLFDEFLVLKRVARPQ